MAIGVPHHETVGQWIKPGKPFCEIADPHYLEAHLIDVPEQHNKAAGTAVLRGYLTTAALDLPGLQVAAADTSLEAELTGLPDDLRVLVICRV